MYVCTYCTAKKKKKKTGQPVNQVSLQFLLYKTNSSQTKAFSIVSFQDLNGRRVQYHVAVIHSVCIRRCLSVTVFINGAFSKCNMIHCTKLITGYIDSFEHLNQQKSHISKECCEAKESLCFTRRIENNKSKKIKTKANAFSEHKCSDHVD